jgi:hypothetical protein
MHDPCPICPKPFDKIHRKGGGGSWTQAPNTYLQFLKLREQQGGSFVEVVQSIDTEVHLPGILANIVNNGHPKRLANQYARLNPDQIGFVVIGKEIGIPYINGNVVDGSTKLKRGNQ